MYGQVETIKAATEPYGIYDVGDDFVAQTGLVDGAVGLRKRCSTVRLYISKLGIYDTPKPLRAHSGVAENEIWICAW